MAQPVLDSLDGERFQMAARLAKAQATQDHLTDLKFLAHEMIERHAARYQVPPGSAWIKLDFAFAREALQCFDFDERNLPIGVARLAKGPLLPAIAIPVQPTPGDGPGLFQVMEILPLLFGEIDA